MERIDEADLQERLDRLVKIAEATLAMVQKGAKKEADGGSQ